MCLDGEVLIMLHALHCIALLRQTSTPPQLPPTWYRQVLKAVATEAFIQCATAVRSCTASSRLE